MEELGLEADALLGLHERRKDDEELRQPLLRSAEAVLDRFVTASHILHKVYRMDESYPRIDWKSAWGLHIVITKHYWKTQPKLVWQALAECTSEYVEPMRDIMDQASRYLAANPGSAKDDIAALDVRDDELE